MCPPGGTWLYCDKKFGEFVQSANSPNIFLNSCSKMPGGASPSPTVLTELSAYFATRLSRNPAAAAATHVSLRSVQVQEAQDLLGGELHGLRVLEPVIRPIHGDEVDELFSRKTICVFKGTTSSCLPWRIRISSARGRKSRCIRSASRRLSRKTLSTAIFRSKPTCATLPFSS